MEKASAEIIYIGDPMCSWCWGIVPELQKLREKYADELGFSLILGGLRPGATHPMDEKMERYIGHHWDQVEAASGQPFKCDILKSRTFVYDTEPPSRAVVIVRDLAPEEEFDFFKSVQEAFYVKNRDTNEIETYLGLCDEYGIDREAFAQAWFSEEIQELTREDFQLAARMGVRSFPTTLLRIGQEIHLVALGYAKFGQMDAAVRQAIEMV